MTNKDGNYVWLGHKMTLLCMEPGERGMIQGWHVSTFECVLTISLRSRMVRHEIVIWSICTLPYLFAPSHVPYPARDGTIVSGRLLRKDEILEFTGWHLNTGDYQSQINLIFFRNLHHTKQTSFQ